MVRGAVAHCRSNAGTGSAFAAGSPSPPIFLFREMSGRNDDSTSRGDPADAPDAFVQCNKLSQELFCGFILYGVALRLDQRRE